MDTPENIAEVANLVQPEEGVTALLLDGKKNVAGLDINVRQSNIGIILNGDRQGKAAVFRKEDAEIATIDTSEGEKQIAFVDSILSILPYERSEIR